MELTINEINNIHYVKGNCSESHLKTIKCYILEKLQNGNKVVINLDELKDTNHKAVYMIQRLKKVLVNRRQLEFVRLVA